MVIDSKLAFPLAVILLFGFDATVTFPASVIAVLIAYPDLLPRTRSPSLFDQRMDWDRFIERHGNQSHFKSHLRMSQASFDKLLSYIRDDIETNQQMALLRGGAILPEVRLYCTIRWLAGGSYSDIMIFSGISKASFYRVVWETIYAINHCNALALHFPKTSDECLEAAAGFESISVGHAINGCVGAIDGWLLKTQTPSNKEVNNVRSFFNGHYQHCGLNIQAVCDHQSRFTYLAVLGPGVMGDNEAYHQPTDEVDGPQSLSDLIEALPLGYYCIGDAAYCPTEHLVSIYGGNEAREAMKDAFNYYASQCRIRIEMAFGLMCKKWGIVWRSGCTKIGNYKHMMGAIARLHNFCINERLGNSLPPTSLTARDLQFDLATCNLREEAANLEALSHVFPQLSVQRNNLVQRIYRDLNLRRP